MKFIVLALIIALFSLYIIFSYLFNWESSKKHWQKGDSYYKFDEFFGISLGLALFILAIFIPVKSLNI